jgi:hypothetical protein
LKKDQFIVICAECPEDAERLLPTARFFAEKLHKGMILLSCAPGAEAWIEQFNVPFMALKGDWKTAIDALPTTMNAVLAITLANPHAPRRSLSHPRTLLKNFRDCKVAYLVLPSQSSIINFQFSITALTIDHQRESKEKLIWASYMARFFGSTIQVMHRNYRDAAFRMRWKNNMRYLDKIFSSLNLTYGTEVIDGGSEFGNPDLLAIKKTSTFHFPLSTLFIALVPDRRDRDLGDLFSKPAELRLIKNDAHLPVLLLNQRDDLYVLCD